MVCLCGRTQYRIIYHRLLLLILKVDSLLCLAFFSQYIFYAPFPSRDICFGLKKTKHLDKEKKIPKFKLHISMNFKICSLQLFEKRVSAHALEVLEFRTTTAEFILVNFVVLEHFVVIR